SVPSCSSTISSKITRRIGTFTTRSCTPSSTLSTVTATSSPELERPYRFSRTIATSRSSSSPLTCSSLTPAASAAGGQCLPNTTSLSSTALVQKTLSPTFSRDTDMTILPPWTPRPCCLLTVSRPKPLRTSRPGSKSHVTSPTSAICLKSLCKKMDLAKAKN